MIKNFLRIYTFTKYSKMSQKKISGYTILMDKLLGKGSYGAVIHRFYLGIQRNKGWNLIISSRQNHTKKK